MRSMSGSKRLRSSTLSGSGQEMGARRLATALRLPIPNSARQLAPKSRALTEGVSMAWLVVSEEIVFAGVAKSERIKTCQYLADMLARVKDEAQRGASRIVVEWEGER